MFPSLKAIDRIVDLGGVDPQSIGSGSTISSGWISAQQYGSFVAMLRTGVISAGGSVNMQIRQAQDSSGTGAKNITGKTLTAPLTNAGYPTSGQAEINVRGDELDVSNGFSYLQIQVTATSAAALASAALVANDPRNGPCSASLPATMSQAVG